MSRSLVFLGGMLSILLSSCNNDFVFDRYISQPELGWHKDSIASFNIPTLDSLKSFNLFMNVRNDNTYKYSNLFLITSLEYPNGKKEVDTLEYEMAYPNGEWIGTGGHLIENKLWFKENFSFKEKGIYKINISHAMRENGKEKGVEFLRGINDIGFRIEEFVSEP